MSITENIRKNLDEKKATGIVALDLSKAFDSISHSWLLKKLPAFGIKENLKSFNFFTDYLSGRRQKAKLNGILSSSLAIKAGVPQGSILGPLLFIMFVNDQPNHFREQLHHLCR